MPRATALLGRGGGATPLPTTRGDVVREGSPEGVDGLDSGRGILEGVGALSGRSEARLGERDGRGVKSEEEALTWAEIPWSGETEEGGTAVEAGGLVCVLEGGFVAGVRLRPSFLLGNGGGVAATGGCCGGGGKPLCSSG